jgi:PAS domain S-box-containing protein
MGSRWPQPHRWSARGSASPAIRAHRWNYTPRLAFMIRPSGSLAQPPKRRNSESGEPMTPSAEILDALPVAVYTTDAQGRITYYNQAAEDLWGHRPKIGSDQWCGSWRLFWPDGRLLPHDECPMAVTLKEGHPVRGVEAIAERPDGTRVPFLPYPTPLRDATGQLVGAINLLMDLTERRRAEVESAQLAAIVASSDDAIISKTLEGRVTSWNEGASRIFGWETSEMIGQPILRIIPPELHDEEVEILARLRRGERIEHFDTVRLAKDGRRVDISLAVSPIRDNSGRVTGASKVARDVTERKEAEKLQRLLVDELNHRVKNTLATVQAIASHSLRRARNSEDFVSSFTGRVQALARAHHLLTDRTWRGRMSPTSYASRSCLALSKAIALRSPGRHCSWIRSPLCISLWFCTSSPPMRASTAHCRYRKDSYRLAGACSRIRAACSCCSGASAADQRLPRLPSGFGEAKMLGKPFSQHEVLAMLAQLFTPRTNVVSLRQKTL